MLVAGTFVAFELVLRVFGFHHPPPLRPMIVWNGREDREQLASDEGLHRFDANTLWTPREGASIPWAEGELVSPAGFRGRDPDPAAEVRVLVLGDSSTFGWGVPFERTYGTLLEERLGAELGRSVQVLNGGIIGSTAVQGVERYRTIRASFVPHAVVAAFGAVNEHFPRVRFDDRAKIAHLRERDGIARRVTRTLNEELRTFQLLQLAVEELRGGRAALLRADLEELERSGVEGWHLEVEEYPRRVEVADYAAALRELASLCAADGATLLLLQMPRRPGAEERFHPIVEYDPAGANVASELGLTRIDARALFAGELAAGAAQDELFLDPFHPTERGHALLAEALAGPVAGVLGD